MSTALQAEMAAKEAIALDTFTSKAITVSEKNKEACALLRLPAELRNKIWEYALTGKTVHVHGLKKMKRYICTHDESEEEVANMIKADPKYSGYGSYDGAGRHSCCREATRHPEPSKSKPETMNLALLQVCRQLHEETALMPYASNTFSFTDNGILDDFTKALTRSQVSAVQSITFVFRWDFSVVPGYNEHAFAKHLQEKLSGLQSLIIFVQAPVLLQYVTSDLLCFRRLPMQSVKVAMCEVLPWKETSRPRYRTFALELEQLLMKDYVGEPEDDDVQDWDWESAMPTVRFAAGHTD